MIVGYKTAVLSALQTVEASNFQFHLTGSRAFGLERPESDYDFFVEKHPALQGWLENSGFHKDCESYECDPVMIAVWQRDNVHVQIVLSAAMKQRIQDNLKNLFVQLKPDKPTARHLWRMAIKCYCDGMDAEQYGVKTLLRRT